MDWAFRQEVQAIKMNMRIFLNKGLDACKVKKKSQLYIDSFLTNEKVCNLISL